MKGFTLRGKDRIWKAAEVVFTAKGLRGVQQMEQARAKLDQAKAALEVGVLDMNNTSLSRSVITAFAVSKRFPFVMTGKILPYFLINLITLNLFWQKALSSRPHQTHLKQKPGVKAPGVSLPSRSFYFLSCYTIWDAGGEHTLR